MSTFLSIAKKILNTEENIFSVNYKKTDNIEGIIKALVIPNDLFSEEGESFISKYYYDNSSLPLFIRNIRIILFIFRLD